MNNQFQLNNETQTFYSVEWSVEFQSNGQVHGRGGTVRRTRKERLQPFLQFRRHPWIEDELRVEVKALRGELVVDDYLRSEVHKLVWDEFGKILRLKDEEKKEISDLVTIRSQLYKDMWKRAIKEATDLLNVSYFNMLI